MSSRDTTLIAALCLLAGVSCRPSPKATAAHHLDLAQKLSARKDYVRAIIELRNAAAATPLDAEPHYQMGIAYLQMGDTVPAVQAFYKATELNPKHAAAQLKFAEFMAVSRDQKVVEQGLSKLQNLVGSGSGDVEAINTLALAEWKLGKKREATSRLEAAVSRFPASLQSSVSLTLMKITSRDFAGAEQVMKAAAAKAPESSEAAWALGETYVVLGQNAKAEAEFRRAIQLDPANLKALRGLGAMQIAAKRIQEADETYRKIAALPDNSYRHLHALFQYRYGDREAALAEFKALSKAAPGDRDARARLIAAYAGLNRAAEAEPFLAEALARNPKDSEALLQRAELRLRRGKISEAEADILQVLKVHPDSAQAHFLQAGVHAANGMVENQLTELHQALSSDAGLLSARLSLALGLLSRKQAGAALEALDQAPAPQKEHPDWKTTRNWAYLSLGDLKSAKAGIEAANNEDPSPVATYQLAALHVLSNNYAEARVSLERLIRDGITDPVVVELLMETYQRRQELPKGLARLGQLVAAHPASAPLNNLLGQWSRRAGDLPAARRAFEKAKAADARYHQADVELANLEVADGKHQPALDRLKPVLAADPGNISALLLVARAHESLGARAEAIATYRRVLSVDSANLVSLNNLAYLAAEDDPDGALKLAEKAAELAPDSANVQDTLGRIYYRKGLYPMAIRSLKTAVAKQPTPSRQFHLGLCYLKAGDLQAGQAMMNDALAKDPKLAATEKSW